MLQDRFNRKFQYLRLSITDQCNFKCNYCLPDGNKGDKTKLFLTLHEIRHLLTAFTELGTEKIRITGGEPSLRKDFTQVIETVKEFSTVKNIACTTNGFKLDKCASQWKEAGLDSINVSVDSLDAHYFNQITGTNTFNKVLKGIDNAILAGFKQIKINSVLLKGLNDQQLQQFIAWLTDKPVHIRFIELMQTDDNEKFFHDHHVSGDTIKQRLLGAGWQREVSDQLAGPAQVFSHVDYQGKIGLIMPYSKDFCLSCNRLRVSATGRLHLCLFGEEGVELRHLLQHAEQKELLKNTIVNALNDKQSQHHLAQGITANRAQLASIGG